MVPAIAGGSGVGVGGYAGMPRSKNGWGDRMRGTGAREKAKEEHPTCMHLTNIH